MLFRHVVPALVAGLFLLFSAACATSQPDPTPDISATVAAEVQGQLAAIPTATPRPTYTPKPSATPRPTATPSPPTGDWETWEKLQEGPKGRSKLPRILLFDDASRKSGAIQFDCHDLRGKLDLELYVQWEYSVPQLQPPFGLSVERKGPLVSYKIDGGMVSVERHWINGAYSSTKGAVFAPDHVRNTLLSAMLDGVDRLEVNIATRTGALVFSPKGFREAAEPVFQACGKPPWLSRNGSRYRTLSFLGG